MRSKTWIETDEKGVQWRVQRVIGPIAWMLCGRSSYLAYRRLTCVRADGCAGTSVDSESRAAQSQHNLDVRTNYMKNQPIAYVTFEKDNGLKCMQDFQCFTNAPAGVRFAVYPVAGMDEKYKLVGPGYGEIPGNYGNGAIYVFGLVRPNKGVQPTAELAGLEGLAADMNPERQPAAADA